VRPLVADASSASEAATSSVSSSSSGSSETSSDVSGGGGAVVSSGGGDVAWVVATVVVVVDAVVCGGGSVVVVVLDGGGTSVGWAWEPAADWFEPRELPPAVLVSAAEGAAATTSNTAAAISPRRSVTHPTRDRSSSIDSYLGPGRRGLIVLSADGRAVEPPPLAMNVTLSDSGGASAAGRRSVTSGAADS
jgi:hypothetical protein